MEKKTIKKNEATPIEIIKNRLYWISSEKPPRATNNSLYFCIDEAIKYEPFFSDYGPVHLAHTIRYVSELKKLLANTIYKSYPIFHYTSLDEAKRANSAYLMGAFQVISCFLCLF